MRTYNLILIIVFGFIACECNNKKSCQQDSAKPTNTAEVVDNNPDSGNQETIKKLREEAIVFQMGITDTTFLKIEGGMSNQAIDPMTRDGINERFAINQVVYVTALERVKRILSKSDNQLILKVTSGRELHISENLFLYIKNLIDDWNKGIKEGKFRIIEGEKFGYDIEPVPTHS